jgi:hypothetical protein
MFDTRDTFSQFTAHFEYLSHLALVVQDSLESPGNGRYDFDTL